MDKKQKTQISAIIDEQQFVNDLEPEKNWRKIFDLNSPKNENDQEYIKKYEEDLKNKNFKKKKKYDFSDIKISNN